MEFDLENPLTSSEDEQHGWGSISALFAAEADHMISTVGLIDLSSRRDAVSLVLQTSSLWLLQREKPWIIQLLSIACLSLASKMRKTNLMLADFQVLEHRFVLQDFKAKSVDFTVSFGFPRERKDSYSTLKLSRGWSFWCWGLWIGGCGPIVIGAATVTATDGCDDSSGMGVASSPETPVTVLGRQSSSSESETAVGSSSDGRELKKRRTTSTLHASCDHSG
ncbi:hypothetical protein B296_00054292 [Ensete ventricosum]|uniref:Cyclin N-terminal domain-containing protein n=1 Tax=Ensete ventricosum TaxID=4639 RepID=A0A426WZD7_ENSVE|nr:hypothetical protein B296_00054292 [Ensete ventricosum]